jgi:3-hydroxyacyl-[acyl-carrier-protein] dehydratase
MSKNRGIFRDDLWTLSSYESNEPASFIAGVTFNTRHRIFDVHFPGNPIVPGACIIQIATELLSHHLSETVILTEAKNIKFTNLINPVQFNEVDFTFKLIPGDNETFGATISVSKGSGIFVKISARFKKI